VEVPSYEFDRIHGQSNLNTWRDGTRVLRALMVERLNHKGRHHTDSSRRNLAELNPTTSAPLTPTPAASVERREIALVS
jgi:hypothetical protein